MQINIKDSKGIFSYIDKESKEFSKQKVRDTTQKAYENVKLFAKPHRVSGTLEKNIRHKIKDNAGIVWIDNDGMMKEWNGKQINYVQFVLYGSKPHPIEPKNKKALRFVSFGNFIFSKRVKKHPGYKGDDFMKKAMQKTMESL